MYAIILCLFKLFCFRYSGETPMYAHLDDFLKLVTTKRHQFKPRHKQSKKVSAYNVKQNRTLVFDSVRTAARELNADRGTMKRYLSNPDKGLYRGQWRLDYTS